MMEITEMIETIDETVGPIPFSEGRHVHNVSIPRPHAPKPEITPEARQLTLVLMWFLLFLVVGTLAGVWIRLFWMGWVFAP